MANAVPPLAAQGLVAGYPGKVVLHGIDLAIEPGCLTVLVGPNGSGKSTLLMALARVLQPVSGQVLLDGRPIMSQPGRDIARRLAILPQSPPRPERLTVFELAARGRYPHQGRFGLLTAADLAAINAALEQTGVADLAVRPLEELSGGQCQRAWIAMALAQQSEIILLDEPTSALDLRYQVAIMALLRDLARQGRTVVAVVHDLNLAAAHADRMVFLREGRVLGSGSPQEICTPAMIHDCFGLKMLALSHPATGRLVFTPAAG